MSTKPLDDPVNSVIGAAAMRLTAAAEGVGEPYPFVLIVLDPVDCSLAIESCGIDPDAAWALLQLAASAMGTVEPVDVTPEEEA